MEIKSSEYVFLKRLKTNGFSRPFHCYQIFSWFYTAAVIVIFYTLISPCFKSEILLVENLIIGILYSIVIVLAFLVTNGIDVKCEEYQSYCGFCQTFSRVLSKHCGQCDRCVFGFDHHCKWLNNCIGDINYRNFILLIVFYLIANLILVIISVSFLICYHANYKNILSPTFLASFYDKTECNRLFIVCYIINWIFGICCGFQLGLSLHLVVFHLFLKCKGMTTYQYIIMQREKKIKKMETQAAKLAELQSDTYRIPKRVSEAINEAAISREAKNSLECVHAIRSKTLANESESFNLKRSISKSNTTFEKNVSKIKTISREKFKVLNETAKNCEFQSIHILNLNQNINFQINCGNSARRQSQDEERKIPDENQDCSNSNLKSEKSNSERINIEESKSNKNSLPKIHDNIERMKINNKTKNAKKDKGSLGNKINFNNMNTINTNFTIESCKHNRNESEDHLISIQTVNQPEFEEKDFTRIQIFENDANQSFVIENQNDPNDSSIFHDSNANDGQYNKEEHL